MLAFSKNYVIIRKAAKSQVRILINIFCLNQRQCDMYLSKSAPSQNVFLLLVLTVSFTSNRISAAG